MAPKKRKAGSMTTPKDQTEFQKAKVGTMNELVEAAERTPQMKYARGSAGLGVVLSEFGGDATLPVYVCRDDTGLISVVTLRNPFAGKPIDKKEEYVGKVSLDAGMLLLADPCYVLPRGDAETVGPGKSAVSADKKKDTKTSEPNLPARSFKGTYKVCADPPDEPKKKHACVEVHYHGSSETDVDWEYATPYASCEGQIEKYPPIDELVVARKDLDRLCKDLQLMGFSKEETATSAPETAASASASVSATAAAPAAAAASSD